MQNQEWQTAVTELSQRMDQMNQQLAALVQSQQYVSEFVVEMNPILKEVMSAGTTELQKLEDKGYFSFGRELIGVLDQIVTGFTPEDVNLLGQNIVGILNTVKGLTQPEMLNLVNSATDPIRYADKVKSVGMLGMLRATRDDDARRGFGVLMEVFRQIGRGVEGLNGNGVSRGRATLSKKEAVRARLAPKRRVKAPAASAPAASAPVATRPKAKPRIVASATPVIEGFSADGYLLDPETWNRDLGVRVAQANGIELTDAHWKIIEFVRADFKEVGKAPNIRRITQGMDVSTKEIYSLFPKAPGRTIAKVAGVPKPGGCL